MFFEKPGIDESDDLLKLTRQLGLERGRLGLGDEREHHAARKEVSSYGMCASCTSFEYVRSEHKVLHSSCWRMKDFNPSAADPVVECTAYEKIGAMSLTTMAEIATLIEVKAEKEPVGFRNNGKH
jgi:hypothetical protein